MSGPRIVGFDHCVLRCADVERSLAWYCGVLGLEPLRVEEWRRGEVLFPSARIGATTIIDFLAGAPDGRNVDHLCLVVEGDLAEFAGRPGLEVLGPPEDRFGARGTGRSVYVRDPDGNVVELRTY